MINIAINLERNAALVPTRTAICFADQEISYAQLNGAANQVANGLKSLGIGRGDKVVLSCPNLPYFPIIYYGILKVGAVVVPINVLLKGPEIAYHLQCSDGTEISRPALIEQWIITYPDDQHLREVGSNPVRRPLRAAIVDDDAFDVRLRRHQRQCLPQVMQAPLAGCDQGKTGAHCMLAGFPAAASMSKIQRRRISHPSGTRVTCRTGRLMVIRPDFRPCRQFPSSVFFTSA